MTISRPLMQELRQLIVQFEGQPKILEALPKVLLRTSSEPTPPLPHVMEPAFALVAQGAKQTMVGDRIYDYRAGQYLIVSVDLPIQGCVVRASAKEPYLGFAMLLRSDVIASLLLEAGAAPAMKSEPPGIAVSDAGDDLLDAVVRLLRLLKRPEDIPVLQPAIEREILWRLIGGPQGAMVRHLGLADSRMAQVGRAIKWLRSHFAEAVRIEELAQMASMSVTSFHRHFRGVTSMSPIQFQKQIRLQQARTRLLSGIDDVANVGYEVGYESPSQFSREYKRLFGTPPGKDGERLRLVHEASPTVA